MTTSHLQEPRHRYFNNDGTVAAGGLLYTYVTGTSTPKATYHDVNGKEKHANPIVLDSKGEAVIFWDGAYRVNLKQKDLTQVTGYPVDDVGNYIAQREVAFAEINAPAGTGSVSVTGLGFRPVRLSVISYIPGVLKVRMCESAVNAAGVSVCHNIAADQPGGTQCKSQGNAMISVMGYSRSIDFAATFTSYDADGFTFNVTTANSEAKIRYTAYAR